MSGNTKNILLVDDDDIDAMSFERALKKSGVDYQLTYLTNANEALLHLEKIEFDCIFLDYQLPGVDGLELLKKIKETGLLTPIAVLTSQGDEKLAVEIMKAGAFDYFPKSEVTPENIARIILSGLRLKASEMEKVKFEQALNENNNRLKTILESTNAIIFSVDQNFRYTAFNSHFKETIGFLYDIEPEIGLQAAYDFTYEDDRKLISDAFQKSMQGYPVTLIEEFGLPSRRRNYFELNFNPIMDEKGNVNGIAIFGQDKTQQKAEERRILESKFEAERTAKAKSEFLSNMSHEIRTPMNAIIGLSDLLLKEKMSDKQMEKIKTIKYSADNLLVIVNDILDFSKIEAGKIEFEAINFDIYSRIYEIQKTFIFKAEEKGIGLKVEINDKVPQFLIGDPYRLNQILLNLLSNAIKFTQKGFVSLCVDLIKETEDQVGIEFSVSDTGIGIPSDKLNLVFESYTQAYSDVTRTFGGTGLGLAITHQLVKLQDGNISVESEPEVGSTFKVSISYPKGHHVQDTISDEQIAELFEKRDFHGMPVLVVEDNLVNQFVARQILELWNIDVDCASDGLEALKLLEKRDYSLVLMDLQMPVMSGYEATKFIRDKTNKMKNPQVPIVALTADALPETRKKVIQEGMNDYLVKPIEQEDLFAKIKAHAIKQVNS